MKFALPAIAGLLCVAFGVGWIPALLIGAAVGGSWAVIDALRARSRQDESSPD